MQACFLLPGTKPETFIVKSNWLTYALKKKMKPNVSMRKTRLGYKTPVGPCTFHGSCTLLRDLQWWVWGHRSTPKPDERMTLRARWIFTPWLLIMGVCERLGFQGSRLHTHGWWKILVMRTIQPKISIVKKCTLRIFHFTPQYLWDFMPFAAHF